MNITCKAVKIHNFSARDFVTYFLICVRGVNNKSLALHQLIVYFQFQKNKFIFYQEILQFYSKHQL